MKFSDKTKRVMRILALSPVLLAVACQIVLLELFSKRKTADH